MDPAEDRVDLGTVTAFVPPTFDNSLVIPVHDEMLISSVM